MAMQLNAVASLLDFVERSGNELVEETEVFRLDALAGFECREVGFEIPEPRPERDSLTTQFVHLPYEYPSVYEFRGVLSVGNNNIDAVDAVPQGQIRLTPSNAWREMMRALLSRGESRSKKETPPKRSWTQTDLDGAIQEYKAKRASRYRDLFDGVKRGQPGAKKAARELFGRNVIVQALGVKSGAMVTNSPVWQDIADELGLRGRSSKSGRPREQRIGMDIALEEQAVASGESAVDQVVRRETIALVEKSMRAAEAEATIEKLQRGEITDDQARELVEVSADQEQDDRTRKIRQGL